MKKIKFENGTLVSNAKVEIGGTIYDVTPEQYEGTTPLSASNMNAIQNNAEEAIDEVTTYKYKLTITADKAAGEEIEIPCKYKVGADVLDVYLNGERLIKSSDDVGTDGHYCEVGDTGSTSNKIKSTTDWNLESNDTLEITVRGEWS